MPGRRAGLWREGWKVHGQQPIPAFDDKFTTAGFKLKNLLRVAENIKYDMRSCQGGMAAEINFCYRCEPTEMKPISIWNEEGGLRKIVLLRDGLKKISSFNQALSGQTAAGLPSNTRRAKAST